MVRGMRGRGACMVEGVHGKGGVHGWGDVCGQEGACVAGGHVWPGVVHGMHTPPLHKIWLVNARAVRILLEYILVFKWFCSV